MSYMIHILLSRPNFDAEWAYQSLSPYITKDKHVLVIPMTSFDEGWESESALWETRYRKGNRQYEKIAAPFRNYQIPDKQITFLNYFKDTPQEIKRKISQADIIYLTGDNPDHMMITIHELDMHRPLLEFDGILIASGYGASIVMDEYDSMYDWEEPDENGLGLLRGFALEPGYIEDEAHLARLLHDIEQKGKNVFAFTNEGGLLIADGCYELLGNAFTVTDADLDQVYQAYEDAKSRQEYYGDNGEW